MGGMSGRTPRNSDLSPSFLVLLGLCVSKVSFAGFRLVTNAKPQNLIAERDGAVRISVASVAPPAFDDFAPRSLVPLQPVSSTPPVSLLPADPEVSPEPMGVSRDPVARPALANVTPAELPQFREIQRSFQSGETISQVLSESGVSAQNAEVWIKAAQRVYNLSRIFAGQKLKLNVDTQAQDLVSLQMEVDRETNLVLRRKEGVVVATREMVELGRRLRVVQGTIAQSFYVSASRADVPEEIISDVAEVLGWDLNFTSDVQPGATFSIFYDETPRAGDAEDAPAAPGRLLAVRIENKGKIHEGIYFRNPTDNSESYLNRDGRQLGRAFLRFPVAYTRISSEFSSSRVHPILKRARPHNGVDLAAPTGTPVRAVADGRVEMADWSNGLGRYVSIRHDDVFESGYGHLSRIAPSLRPGSMVRQGQVIGYVGATGLATGPHLHYVMYKNGTYINPMSAAMPRARSVTGSALERFRGTVTKIDAAYAAAARAGGRLAVASAPAADNNTRKN